MGKEGGVKGLGVNPGLRGYRQGLEGVRGEKKNLKRTEWLRGPISESSRPNGKKRKI